MQDYSRQEAELHVAIPVDPNMVEEGSAGSGTVSPVAW